ncbi:twin-arginine translocase TatA/TatE family subunit [Denitrobacterium detoxificans]|jgi:sec-independent protein translocase protein TatA|uniref:twin-arginine translocase TatA/TatE family subunit n=1 Tax=Denitrobacterium detoxificans TaxID=79604 RepID=UPI0026F31C18|nr:twin-arginine translocase TatA/TatE family subunit [Denitrobacterium detoxificans]MBE6466253.1 twin-arginine translocase TatA/TatE family subunit [Denitrobacterium detoxificans]
MKFGGLGPVELIIILVVVLLIFGPKNLPKLGSAIGRTVKNLRKGMGDSEKGENLDETESSEESEDDSEKKSK